MPNGEKMVCKHDLEKSKTIAMYYKTLSNAENVSAEVRIKLGMAAHNRSKSETEVKYKMDGINAENPIAECLASGECRIEKY